MHYVCYPWNLANQFINRSALLKSTVLNVVRNMGLELMDLEKTHRDRFNWSLDFCQLCFLQFTDGFITLTISSSN